jgi:CRISPR-associated endonuclease Cas1
MVADGQNVIVCVRNSQLKISDGLRSNRRDRIVPRTPRTASRLVILGTIGYITLEAIRWCAEENIIVTQHDKDGNLILTTPSHYHDNSLLRSQILITSQGNESPAAISIMRRLISAKLSGQAEIAHTHLNNPNAASTINAQLSQLQSAPAIDMITGYEGRAATAYWQAWQDVTVPFSPTDLIKIPSHWITFPGRISAPGATDPINALLSYTYRIAETEARNACHINGLDPAFGFSHALKDGRDSLALDLMEAIRPACDRIVLSLLDYGHGMPADSKGRPRYFPYAWVYELQHGITRLYPPLTHMLAEHAADLAEDLAPVLADIVSLIRKADTAYQPSVPVRAHLRRYAPPRIPGKPFRDTRMPVPSSAVDVIPDDAWKIISKHIPVTVSERGGAPRMDDRIVIAALVWCAANNLPATHCPDTLPVSRSALYDRKARWQRSGAWQHIAAAVSRTVLPGYCGD